MANESEDPELGGAQEIAEITFLPRQDVYQPNDVSMVMNVIDTGDGYGSVFFRVFNGDEIQSRMEVDLGLFFEALNTIAKEVAFKLATQDMVREIEEGLNGNEDGA